MNELRGCLKVSWDDLVIEAVYDRYGLDRVVMALAKKGKDGKAQNTRVEGRGGHLRQGKRKGPPSRRA